MREFLKGAGQDPNVWWGALAPCEKALLRDLIQLTQGIADDQVLKLSFNGATFSPVLISKGDPRIEPRPARSRVDVTKEEPEIWWAGLSPVQRDFVRGIARIIGQLERNQDQSLELRKMGGGLRATRVLTLKQPVGGSAVLN